MEDHYDHLFLYINGQLDINLLCDADGSLVCLDASTIMCKIHFLGKNNGFGIYLLNHLEKDNSIRKKKFCVQVCRWASRHQIFL